MARPASTASRRSAGRHRAAGMVEGLCFALAVAFTASIALGLMN